MNLEPKSLTGAGATSINLAFHAGDDMLDVEDTDTMQDSVPVTQRDFQENTHQNMIIL